MGWKDPKKTGPIVGGATLAYFFVEYSGYTLIAMVANLLMLAVVVCFVWGNVAGLIGKAPPPIPNLQIEEGVMREVVEKAVSVYNKAAGFVVKVLSPGDAMLSVKVVGGLWFVAKIGNYFPNILPSLLCYYHCVR